MKRHNLPNVSPHDLRHTAATLALEGGADLKQVQQLLGHKDPATTMRFYTGVTEEAERRTVQGIESVLASVENGTMRYPNNVRAYREYHGVSQQWLARKAKCG